MNKRFISSFERKGYAIAKATDLSKLDLIRSILLRSATTLGSYKESIPDVFFNKFHEQNVRGPALNDLRVSLIKEFNERIDVGQVIYDAFENIFRDLIGTDIAVQKSCNLVIQQPGDIDVSPVHRDAPPNSNFEVVVWIPLVDCYGTKGLSILGRDQTEEILSMLRVDGTSSSDEATSRAMEIGKPLSIPYGSACFFWSGLYHAIPVNEEPETRWSLNIRYKNVFSPYGNKGLPDFFRILKLSPLARHAIETEKKALFES